MSPDKKKTQEKSSEKKTEAESELVQAQFKVSDEVKKQNSDSDCAYFSGPENDDE